MLLEVLKMAKKSLAKGDSFSQVAYLDITQSAADTFTVSGPTTVGSSLFDQQAMVLHRIEYQFADNVMAALNAANDFAAVGLVGSNTLTTLLFNQAEVYDTHTLLRIQDGAPASHTIWVNPVTHDFTNLPGGGKIVPGDKIYLAVQSAGTGVACRGFARVTFTVIGLSAAEYLQLAQAMRVF